MQMQKSKVSIQFLLPFRQSGDVFFFLYARRLREYTATLEECFPGHSITIRISVFPCSSLIGPKKLAK